MVFYAYLLRCNDGSYYAGHTDNLETRFAQHVSGAFGGYTAKRLPVTLVWSESFQTRDEAFAAEHRMKGLEPGEEGSPDCRGLGAGFEVGAEQAGRRLMFRAGFDRLSLSGVQVRSLENAKARSA